MLKVSAAQFQARYLHVYPFDAPLRRVQSRTSLNSDSLIVMKSGWFSAQWQNGCVEAGPGDVVFRPVDADWVESNDPASPMHCLVVAFRTRQMPDGLPPLVHDRQNLISALAQALLLARESSLVQHESLGQNYLGAMLAEYIRLALTSEQELVMKVARYTRKHIRRQFTAADLSDHVGLSKRYFGRRYKALTGRAPMQDVRRIRIDSAVRLLRSEPDLPLKDIASQVGMTNCHLLSRWLRKSLNLTSREIRA